MTEHHPICPEAQGAEDMCACRLIEEVLDYVDYETEAAEQRGYERAVEERVNRIIYGPSDIDDAVQRGWRVGLRYAIESVRVLVPEMTTTEYGRGTQDGMLRALDVLEQAAETTLPLSRV
jgi:hypothetical protein